MIGAQNVGMDFGPFHMVLEIVRDQEVVDTPAGIFLSGLEAVRPPAVDALLVRIEMTEAVYKSAL